MKLRLSDTERKGVKIAIKKHKTLYLVLFPFTVFISVKVELLAGLEPATC